MATPDRRITQLAHTASALAPTRRLALLVLLALASVAACHKDQAAAPPPAAAPAAPPANHIDVGAISARVGVKPGPLTHAGVGPAAALMESLGAVSVRRVGEELFADAPASTPLYAGDQVWTGPHAQATVAFADDSLVELAEETVIAIGNRAVSSDPASSASVLYGVARLSISPRARGEGAFITTAAGTVIGAKGTAIVVGLAAGGHVRVGIEHGEAEVAAPNTLDKPLTLETEQVVLVDGGSVVGAPAAFKTDDWGTWRFGVEGAETLETVARHHADALVGAESRLDGDYIALQTLGTKASTLTWQAEAGAKNASPKAAAEYKATATDRVASIEGMYRLALEISRLTNAALSDAFILSELYARHPKEVEPQFLEFSQEMAGALLYDKKLQVVADVYLAPLRPAYYAHTAHGRASAASLEMPAPAFASVKLVDAPAEIAKRVPAGLYAPPRIDSTIHGHPVWQGAPNVGWNERLTLQPVPTRQSSWYVAPVTVDAKLLVGVASRGAPPAAFPTVAAIDAANVELSFLIPPLPPIGPAKTP
jgi:FecR protein